MSPAGYYHGRTGFRFANELCNYVLAHRLGDVLGADVGFVLLRNPDTVRCPDVAFVRADRIPDPPPTKFWEGPPDLAVEVISPSDTVFEVDEKVQTWLDSGTLEVVVINPRQRTIKIIDKSGGTRIFRPGESFSGLASVPGFQCAVADIFTVG
jgi:Uma2 family endonuclease